MIQGAIAAAITPRLIDGTAIDSAAALDLVDFLESHGVDGITLLGSTGEFPHFDIEDRNRLVASVLKRSRVPVLVNASHSAFEGAVDLARAATDAGAAGVLVMPPYYFRYGEQALRSFFVEFAARLKVPAYLYNIPQFTNEIPTSLAVDLLAAGTFAGIKDSSGSWETFEALQRCGFCVFVGSERIYSRARAAGAAGTISGVASAVPELIIAIDRRSRAGKSISDLDRYVAEFLDRSNRFPFPMGIRQALAARGVHTGPHAIPFRSPALDEFRSWFRECLPEVQRACC